MFLRSLFRHKVELLANRRAVCGMLSPTPRQIGRQKLPVDREKVRIPVGEIRYTEVAKRTGITRNTLYQWNYRYKWSILPADSRSVRNVTTLSPSVPSVAAVTHLKAGNRCDPL